MMASNPILDELRRHGIDYERLKGCLDDNDNWGGMVHAFEYLTVCSVVEIAFRREAQAIAREGGGSE